jgi:hypothetical protein
MFGVAKFARPIGPRCKPLFTWEFCDWDRRIFENSQ